MTQENKDSFAQKDEVCVINPLIWKKSGLPRSEFLSRMRGVKAIRIYEMNWVSPEETRLPLFSYFPSSMDSWTRLEQLHHLANEGDFSVFDERTEKYVFAMILPPQLATWLRHTKIATFQRQIIHWLAAYSTFSGKFPGTQVVELPPGIRENVASIQREHYGTRFSREELWETAYPERPNELLKHYEDVARTITGAAPPEILKLRPCDFDNVDLESWGLSRGRFGGWPGLTFQYSFAYFRPDDWERIVVKGETDDLIRAESSHEWWQKLLHTLETYPKRKSLIFSTVGEEVQMGFVYLFHDELREAYKIGFHAGPGPYGRRGSLQTGNPEKIVPAGHFRVASQKTETIIKQLFAPKRVRPDGEWFVLSEQDVANLLDENWRVRNNIF